MDETVLIKVVKVRRDAKLPTKATAGAACFDVCACLPPIESDIKVFPERTPEMTIFPERTAMVPTGLRFEIQTGYEILVRSRSGLAAKHSISVTNSAGCIDSDFRGEIHIILTNHGEFPFTIHHGDRIAQLSIQKVLAASFIEVDKLSDTERGEGGFGSTGVQSPQSGGCSARPT